MDEQQQASDGGVPEIPLAEGVVSVRLDMDAVDQQIEQIAQRIQRRVSEAVVAGLREGRESAQEQERSPDLVRDASRVPEPEPFEPALRLSEIDGGREPDVLLRGDEDAHDNMRQLVEEGVNLVVMKLDDLMRLVEESNEIQQNRSEEGL